MKKNITEEQLTNIIMGSIKKRLDESLWSEEGVNDEIDDENTYARIIMETCIDFMIKIRSKPNYIRRNIERGHMNEEAAEASEEVAELIDATIQSCMKAVNIILRTENLCNYAKNEAMKTLEKINNRS